MDAYCPTAFAAFEAFVLLFQKCIDALIPYALQVLDEGCFHVPFLI
jgi:hypothetical protein